jgi:aminomethyltransferase
MTTTTAPVSPLLVEHDSLGAHLIDFAGWQMPLKYGSELAEHHAVRSTAGLFDLSHMGEILIAGSRAGEMLDHALVGELSKIAVGRAKYSLLCDADGGVLDDLVVYRLANDRFLVVANASNAAVVSRELVSRAAEFGVVVKDQSADTALIAVQGPEAAAIITGLVSPEQAVIVEALKYYACAPAVVAGVYVLLARTGYTGEDGFELYVDNGRARELWRSLLDATTARGGTAAGLACRDSLRLEAGMALYGNELTVDTNPYEAGLGRVVRLDKPFVGRDALQRVAAEPVTRTLVGLAGSGRRAARAGYSVCTAAGDGVIGTVTSGALSPTLGYPIALAYVDASLGEPGTEVTVDIRGTKQPFTVVTTPFYRRSN